MTNTRTGPQTLFGSRDNTVSALSGAGKDREQTVFTPTYILDIVRKCFGGQIQYDPCHGEPGHVLTKAGREWLKEGKTPNKLCLEHYNPVESQVDAVRHTTTNGLIDPWPNGTFANTPYDKLRDWLAFSLEQDTDIIMLGPVRPNRPWWREWARTHEVVYLNPVKFEGHYQAFPAPVCLARRGMRMVDAGVMTGLCEAAGIGGAV